MHRASPDHDITTVLKYRMEGKPEFLAGDDHVDPETTSFWRSLPVIEQGGLRRLDNPQLLLLHRRCEDKDLPKIRAAILVRIWGELKSLSAA